MNGHRTPLLRTVALWAAVALLLPAAAAAQSARDRYTAALEAEQEAREVLAGIDEATPASARTRAMRQARDVVASYLALVRRYHGSGYSDNALFNAAGLSQTLFDKFGEERDRRMAAYYLHRLTVEYPTSSLLKRMAASTPAAAAVAPATATPTATAAQATLVAIERSVLPDVVRVTLALDREVRYSEHTLTGPARLFFDLQGVTAAPDLTDAVLRYSSDAVRQIRIGRHPEQTLRVVLDLEDVVRHSVHVLYNPFRLVVDAERTAATTASGAPAAADAIAAATAAAPPGPAASALPVVAVNAPEPTVPSLPTAPTPTAPPKAPTANGAGGFSIARQLGLGISRIVIDPGHGGSDPGAMVRGLNEAELTLDIALRLEKLLAAEPGLEVVLTRRADAYVPLEERTAIANRESADLFLSIHANASRNLQARGVETYFLSFASSPEAEAVAARENAASARDMRTLPDIIKTIALNNKLDESRDLAGMVQEALVSRLRRSNRSVRNLGVKKAPFVVLIGAEMPSVLAEVSFLTNKQELALLKTAAYKQRIAEALHAAVLRYRRSLKGATAVAER